MGWTKITEGTAEEVALCHLVRPVRERMRRLGLSQARVAQMTGFHRSTISRALSGRVLPSRKLVTEISRAVGCDVHETERRWWAARGLVSPRGEGWPPSIVSYPHLLRELRQLMVKQGISQRMLDDQVSRSTVGAALRGQRSLSRDVMEVIVHACEVSNQAAVAAWLEAWDQFGLPHLRDQHERRRKGHAMASFKESMRRLEPWLRSRRQRSLR